MDDAILVAAAAEQTAAKLFRFAEGEPNDVGATVQPDCVAAVVQTAGAFQYFAAALRQKIAEQAQ